MKVTRWYPGHVLPVHKGVYMRQMPYHAGVIFSRWTGKYWRIGATDKERAACSRYQSAEQCLRWCGIEKPRGQDSR